MKVLLDSTYEVPESDIFYYNFNKYLDDRKNLIFVHGIFGENLPEGYKNKIYLNLEEPNGLYHSAKLLTDRELGGRIVSHDWTKIYQICPYSTKWLHDILGDTRYEFMDNFPIADNVYFPNPVEPKIYDTVYQGSIQGYRREFSPYIDEITKFKYIYMSISDGPDPRRTHFRLPYLEKLKLLSQCKMTIVDNRLYDPHPGAFATNCRKLPKWNENEAFSHIDFGVMPQMKLKLFSSSICRVLTLAQKSPWDVMEKFGFVEGEHFFYFEDPSDLNSLIQGCLAEWSYCEKMIEKMFIKVSTENSIDAIYAKYLKQYDI
jgi:hypothetical protein